MNPYLYIIIPLLSLLTTILDTSLFSFYEAFGATIISTFAVIVILAVLDYKKQAVLFAFWSVLFFSALSSLPIYILFLVFVGLPLLIFVFRSKFNFDSGFIIILVLFFLSNLLFRLLLLIIDVEISREMVISLISFPIINTLFCLIIYPLIKKITKERGY